MSLTDKLVTNAAITGTVPGRKDSPHVPTTIDEIFACAQQVYDAGASIVHFVRASPLELVGLGHMISLLPEGATWSVGGIGKYQLDANVLAVAAGGARPSRPGR